MLEAANTERGPIFIGGLAHSGKTLLRLMLAAHPDLVLSRRTYMWSRFYRRYSDLGRPNNYERCLEAMLKQKGIRALQPDAGRIRREFAQGPPTYGRLFALFHEHHAQRLGKRRWGDQLGFVERFAAPIFAAYPSAKMIHMVRDPRDRCQTAMAVSRYRKGKVGWAIARWLYSARLARHNRERYPGRYKVVRYEALIARPEATLRDICDFLGEEFLPEMVAAATAGDAATSDDTHQNGRPFSARDVAFTQSYARRHLLAFDYPLQPTALSLSDRLLFYFVDWPANRAGMAAWNILNARSPVQHSRE
jgi:hypothetical protein